MRMILQRHHEAEDYQADMHKQERLEDVSVFRCGVCTLEIPSSYKTIEDGRQKCPMCKDIMTAEWKAAEAANVARVKEESAILTYKPHLSWRNLNEPEPSAVNNITDVNDIDVNSSAPLALAKGGTAKTLKLKGIRFASTDTISYSAGISDNSAPSRTSTVTTLSLIASGAMAAGSYSLTFNGSIFRDIFSVR